MGLNLFANSASSGTLQPQVAPTKTVCIHFGHSYCKFHACLPMACETRPPHKVSLMLPLKRVHSKYCRCRLGCKQRTLFSEPWFGSKYCRSSQFLRKCCKNYSWCSLSCCFWSHSEQQEHCDEGARVGMTSTCCLTSRILSSSRRDVWRLVPSLLCCIG